MTGAYLLEEWITDNRGKFIKFIHNVPCAPLLEPGEEGYDLAEFLVFTQHVQYVKTKGLAYIADYQGRTLHRLVYSLPFLSLTPRSREQTLVD